MTTSQHSELKTSPQLKSGLEAGLAKTLATQTPTEKDSKANEVDSSTILWNLLHKYGLDGLLWKTSSASLAQRKEPRLKQLPTNLKRSGIWGGGFRATLSMRVFPTIENVCSLWQVIDQKPPMNSFLTAANCSGILRREERAGRMLDPIFEKSLLETLRFWYSVGEALGTPKQKILAPRYVPKLASIKEVIQTDQFYVARNLTWDECETLMGFPEGWTVVEGDSLATQSPRQSQNGLQSKS